MKNMRTQLIELLNIHATSGNEEPVRNYLILALAELVNTMKVDDYGNLLATKKVGTGKGATILLSAHMDTVKGVLKDRKLIEKNGIIHSDKGVLGADDRAGIAIILSVLRNVDKIESFNGTLKIAFSREEEIGCIGATNIDSNWYSDVDLAIVIDRRGNRDIVVGCSTAFCSNSVGFFLEDVSEMCDMDWKCVEGGVSDALIFSQTGINSVNLSAGYMNEHTDKEWVSLMDMKDTMKLIMQTLAVVNQFVGTFEEIEKNNKWVVPYNKYSYSKEYYSNDTNKKNSTYYEDAFDNQIWIEEQDKNGEVLVYEIGSDVVIQQGGNEIVVARQTFLWMMKQANLQIN